MTQPTISPALEAHASDDPLAKLVGHLRVLVEPDAVALIGRRTPGSEMETLAGWYAAADLREALALRRPFGRGRPGLAELALGAEESLLVSSLADTAAAAGLEGREAASLIACPLRAATGEALGALVVVRERAGRPLSEPDLRVAEVVAALAASAIERSEGAAADERDRRFELALGRAAEAISSSLELDAVYRRVVEQAAAVTGAQRALLTRFNARSGELLAVARVDFSDELGELTIDSGSFGNVARTRAPVLRRRGEADGFDLGLMEREDIGALLHAPIVIGPRLYGVLTVAHRDAEGLGPDELELLERLARSSAAAVANAIDFERERRIARALTLGFLPASLPDLPGYETGLAYAPAENEPTGGDVYGAWPVAGGSRLALLIGDVAGKGVETAALSSMVRFFIEARSWDTPCPAQVLGQTNEMLLGRLPRDSFVTAFLAIISEDELCFANAGHLQPLVAGPEGVRQIGAEPGLPLGVAEGHEYRYGTQPLARGELVFAYTDGLIEARRSGEMFGAERLTALVGSLAGSLAPAELVRTVHEEVSAWADRLADDAVALALRRTP